MTDQEFRNMLLAALSDLKEQVKENNERLEKRIEDVVSQVKENNERLEKRLDSIDTRLGRVEQDVGWVKGKLEGKQESRSSILVVFSTGAAIAAVIISLIALFS